MKRSSAVGLVLVTAAAAGFTACRQKPTRYCVDSDNQVAGDGVCEAEKDQKDANHHWYYGGAHGYVSPGIRLSGGSTTEPAEGFTTPSGTVRGGIGEAGESASGHGGGGEGGGGE